MKIGEHLKRKSIFFYDMKIDPVQIPEVIDIMQNWIKEKDFSNYIVISNCNDFAMGRKNLKVKEAVNNSSLSVPDGFSLVLLSRLHGHSLDKRVYGPDLMLEFLKQTEENDYSHFFYGATDGTLKKLVFSIKDKFPKVKIAGSYSPPFRDLTKEEEEKAINIINEKVPDVLWVGLGCPKQQLWMYKNKDRVNVPVMVGVGAAFDFLSGTKPQAPRWIRDNGFEWLFRLITEPKRLWKRYLFGNSIFLWLFLKEFVKIKIIRKELNYD